MQTSPLTLDGFASRVVSYYNKGEDWIACNKDITVVDHEIVSINGQRFKMTNHFVHQLNERLRVSQAFSKRMRKTHPDLFAANLNALLHESSESQLIRFEENTARAYLPVNYDGIDHYDLCNEIIPILNKKLNVKFLGLNLTLKKLTIKAVLRNQVCTTPENGRLLAGVVITNSEIGLGKFKVDQMLYHEQSNSAMIMRSNDIICEPDHEAAINEALSITRFDKAVDQMAFASYSEITDLPGVLENLPRIKGINLNKTQLRALKGAIISDNDFSGYRLILAISQLANRARRYDDSTELEYMAGLLLKPGLLEKALS